MLIFKMNNSTECKYLKKWISDIRKKEQQKWK